MGNKTKLVTLDNGATIISHKIPYARTAQVQWSLTGGADAERKDQHGVAHFLEHLLVHPGQIYKPLSRKGVVVNAYTSRSHIAMWARGLPEKLPEAQQRIFDHGLRDPAFGQADFDREFGPIKMEITGAYAKPDRRLHLQTNAAMFGDEPLGHFTCGTHADMDTHSLGKLRSYFEQVRSPRGIVALAVGDFSQPRFLRMAERQLRDLPSVQPAQIAPSHFRPGELLLIEPVHDKKLTPDEQEVSMEARFRAVSLADERKLVAFRILGGMLSAGMDSPLMDELRVKRGLVYGVSASTDAWENDGFVDVSLNTSRARIEAATATLADTLAGVQKHLTSDRFDAVKEKVKFSFADSVETPGSWANRAVFDMKVHGRIRSEEERRAPFAAVTLQDVREVAEYAFSAPAFVAVRGPVEGLSFKPVFDRALRL